MPEGRGIVENNHFKPGDEFTYHIIIKVENDKVISAAAIQQGPTAQDFARRLAKLENDLRDVKTDVAVQRASELEKE